MSRAVDANRQAAAKLVVVDAVEERAASLTSTSGFKPVAGTLTRLAQKLSSIKAALGR